MTLKVAILGAGAWGTALGLTWARGGARVSLIGRRKELIDQIKNGFHPKIGDIGSHENLYPSTDINEAKNADVIILATPAQTLSSICAEIRDQISSNTPVVITAKGIDLESQSLLSDGVSNQLGNKSILCLSGPSFAADMAQNLPTAVTLGAANMAAAQEWSAKLSTPQLRLYASDDLAGVQYGGALKNVLAIASGIVNGFGLGESAKAALITRAFVEMQRYACFFGARGETLYGLSGLGDLILTSNSPKSRNYAYGTHIGEAAKANASLPTPQGTVEGFVTTLAVHQLAQKHDISMPIVDAVHDIIYNEKSVGRVIDGLMSRPMASE